MFFYKLLFYFTPAFFIVFSARAQQNNAIMATHSEAAISIDGLPDEPAWKNAEVIDQFIQREPAEGSMQPEKQKYASCLEPTTCM
jgi:hypothetical protein